MYIRQSKLRNLRAYQYSGVDHSLVSRYILKPFYTTCVVPLFPMAMAPNLITLSGFSFIIVNFLTLLWYNPMLDKDCPPWVYASWSAGLFLYQTFDACDGQQARRTKQSGPLGELFDHGVDALNTSLGVIIFAGAVNLGYSWALVLTMFASLCAFYLTTWEEYHTGTLYLGLVSGPVEGVLTLCTVYAVTAIKGGGSYWSRPMLQELGLPQPKWMPEELRNLSFAYWYLVYGGVMLTFNVITSSYNVAKARRSHKKPILPALAGLLPFFGTWACVAAWLSLRPNILHQHLIPFMFFIGVSFAYNVGMIITGHLVKNGFPFFNILQIPILVGTLDAAGPWIQDMSNYYGLANLGWASALGEGEYEIGYVFLCLGLAIGIHGSFIVDVITNICDYLDIWCLTIKHRQDLPRQTTPPPVTRSSHRKRTSRSGDLATKR